MREFGKISKVTIVSISAGGGEARHGRHPLRRRRASLHLVGRRLDEDGLDRRPPQVGPGRIRRPQADPLRRSRALETGYTVVQQVETREDT